MNLMYLPVILKSKVMFKILVYIHYHRKYMSYFVFIVIFLRFPPSSLARQSVGITTAKQSLVYYICEISNYIGTPKMYVLKPSQYGSQLFIFKFHRIDLVENNIDYTQVSYTRLYIMYIVILLKLSEYRFWNIRNSL